MDILNFISWIRGKRVVNSVNPNKTLLPVGLKDDRRDDAYLAGAITVQDFTVQVASVIPAGAQGPQGPQGVPGPVGPAGLNWQGAWSAAGTYVVDDAVGYGGASWFCINNVGPSATTPNSDPTNWALLASQGATGPQGPQGIQGPQGPSGSGLPGTIPGQTDVWNGTSWMPTFGLSVNPSTGVIGTARVGIGITTLNTTGYALSMATNNGGIRIAQTQSGFGIYNLWTTPTATFQFGLNPPFPGNPIFNNSVYFTQNGPNAIKFATNFNSGAGDRLIIQGNGQVTLGNSEATNIDGLLVLKTGNIELEQITGGVIMASPDGTRYKLSIANGGTVTVTAV